MDSSEDIFSDYISSTTSEGPNNPVRAEQPTVVTSVTPTSSNIQGNVTSSDPQEETLYERQAMSDYKSGKPKQVVIKAKLIP